MPRNNVIQFRKGTYTQWDTQASTVLASGEPGFVTDFNKLKIGDGTTQWSDLSAINDALTTTVYNGTANTIPKMSVVYITGAQGDLPSVTLSVASGELTSSKTYGITTSAISAGGTGQVVVDGSLKNLDTLTSFSGVSPGTTLWLSPTTSGGITTTKPYAPSHMVALGTLIRVHQTQGVINVKIQNGFELEELHNVAVTGATNGQFLQYNSGSGLWIPSSSGNFTNLNVNNNPVWHSGNFDTTNIVRTTGNQTIAGVKTLNNNTIFNGNNAISIQHTGIIDSSSLNIVKNGDTYFNFYPGLVGTASGCLLAGLHTSSSTAPFRIVFDTNGSDAYITNGIWRASTIAVDKGGTGQTSYSNGQILIGSGTTLVPNTLTAGSGITITNGSGNITINTTGLQTVLTNPVTGTGIVNHIPYWNSSSGIIADSGQLYWDSTNHRLGIGITSPFSLVHVSGTLSSNYGHITLNTSSISTSTHLGIGNSDTRPFLASVNGDLSNSTYGWGLFDRGTDGNLQLQRKVGSTSWTSTLLIDRTTGNIGIGTNTPSYKLQVNGSFGATTKSFRIDHPNKKGYSLEYGSLESPYHGVRLTGRAKVVKGVGTVQLPDYLKDLIHNDHSITIQLTNYKHSKTLYVSKIDLQNNQFIVKADRAKTLGELEFFWTLTGIRKDVEYLVVEKEN